MRRMKLGNATRVTSKTERTLCVLCQEDKRFFYKKTEICWACVSIIPEHIPDKQIERYIRSKACVMKSNYVKN